MYYPHTPICKIIFVLGLLIFPIAACNQAAAMFQVESPATPIVSPELIDGDIEGTIVDGEGSVEIPKPTPLTDQVEGVVDQVDPALKLKSADLNDNDGDSIDESKEAVQDDSVTGDESDTNKQKAAMLKPLAS